MENILDTLQKYRKEVKFLLMNLDLDNMPTIGGLIRGYRRVIILY